MAEEDKTSALVTPEQKLAARVFARHSLSVPVDVEGLARRYADIQQAELPGDVDAIAIDSPALAEDPTIFVDKRLPRRRYRFTLAHELGHLIIPWHLGIIGCHPTAFDGWSDVIYEQGESEANRFASELLLPSLWLRDLAKRHPSFPQLWTAAGAAEASDHATLIALARVLEPGKVLVLADGKGRVQLSSRSPGTAMDSPSRGAPLDLDAFQPVGATHETTDANFAVVHCWTIRPRPIAVPADDAATILDRILTRHHQNQARQSISGVIGAANSMYRTANQDQLANTIRQRLASRPDLRWLVTDSEFEDFVAARAAAIIARRQT